MDPIADFLTIIRNGYAAKRDTVTAPYSQIKHSLAQLLLENNYLKNLEIQSPKNPVQKKLLLTLFYPNQIPAITNIKRISHPSVRYYAKARQVKSPLSTTGITIISTSQGLMTDKTARKKNLGGEIICQIY